ncbi:MAG: hypothetical protein KA201_38820, partial [Kofleriaceae bacterium]|nr:hypothetical protein [Kofleriaceae bacterium]
GESLSGGTVNGSSISLTSATRGVLTNAQLVGTVFTATVYGVDATISVRLDAVVQAADPTPSWYCPTAWSCVNLSVNEHADVYRYKLSWYEPAHNFIPGTWRAMCANDAYAVASAGSWGLGTVSRNGRTEIYDRGQLSTSTSQVTFSCEDTGPIAKCIYAGYKPWLAAGPSYTQACVRMVRADYCGDGIAHTSDGTPIEATDVAGLNAPLTSAWGFEAEWGATGAICASQLRYDSLDPLTGQPLSTTLAACGVRGAVWSSGDPANPYACGYNPASHYGSLTSNRSSTLAP